MAEAHDTLLRRLESAEGRDAERILHTLNVANVIVPSALILRHLATTEAIVAAGLSGEVALVPHILPMLQTKDSWQAALALARLGQREHAHAIAARIESAKGLEVSGLLVALEVMGEPSVVPALRDALAHVDRRRARELHHALWRLTGREPIVAFDGDLAFADAWRDFDLAAPTAPRLENVRCDATSAYFDLRDGRGDVRIDYDPPSPGSLWPRWEKSLYVGTERLFEIGSDCDTCETTLRRLGASDASKAASQARAALADVRAVDPALLDALKPTLERLRTGHYLARVVDLDLVRVEEADASWLTRRVEHRQGKRRSHVAWPGGEHFQVREAAAGDPTTYGIVMPQADLETLDAETITRWSHAIEAGDHPTAIVLSWVEDKNIDSEEPERFLVGVVLDGHHKLAAHAKLERPARVLALCRIEDTWGPPEDPSRLLREAFASLGAR